MRMISLKVWVLSLAIYCGFAVAAEPSPKGLYIIFDASGSMWQKLPDGEFRIDAARRVLAGLAAGEYQGLDVAFRAYGHRRKGDCRDSELMVPFSEPETALPKLKELMTHLEPTGMTPITYSLIAALEDFGGREGEIVLISDGEETCDADPCELVRAWREKEIRIRVHVVGLGLDDKSRAAMKCISDAAGTAYRDADSAAELAEGLGQIQRTASAPALLILGRTATGKEMSVNGEVTGVGKEALPVASHLRNALKPGKYSLSAGVKTKNGTIYRPVTQMVEVAERGDTRVDLTVVEPPSVTAHFGEGDAVVSGSPVHAYMSGKKAFELLPGVRAYIDEGSYEFRAKPNVDNDLKISETFAAGEHKDITFQMAKTVLVKVRVVASGTRSWFRENCELWQEGKKRYSVHVMNGARVEPGTYEIRLPNELTPFAKPDLVVTDEKEQQIEVIVPVGHLTVVYQRADGARDKDDRCFVGRGEKGSGVFKQSGEKIPLTAGKYNVTGWAQKGKYDPVAVEIAEGQDREVVLRAK
ncbi:MAG: hypothetical protein HYX75_21045 [Acidobacteria bacterium]|nr:hypothetical protein [Acidobacteriota bacterium]